MVTGHPIRLPQVDKILREPTLISLALCVRREIIANAVRMELSRLRLEYAKNYANTGENREITAEAVALAVKNNVTRIVSSGIERVINGTGVVLSTNLGRAPLPAQAVKRLSEALGHYSNLEFDLSEGQRGERTRPLAEMFGLLTGAEQGIVVNNCAAAVMLATQALAAGLEVIVSRGELIEIGGSFRLPDVIAASGATLREVGTTNKTRLADYERAINERTGLILKCHRSNFQIVGFTEECSLAELSALARTKNIPLAYDLGAGQVAPAINLGQGQSVEDPTIAATIEAGVDLVMFSGDKLLGGPQAGIILGRTDSVAKLRQCPTYRALRADKVVLALLESVVAQYLIEGGMDDLPVVLMARLTPQALKARAEAFANKYGPGLEALTITPIALQSTMGGGSLPGETIESFGIALTPAPGKISTAQLSRSLRKARPPVIGSIAANQIRLDFRTIKEGEEDEIAVALKTIDDSLKQGGNKQ